jgi:hypothetical protein
MKSNRLAFSYKYSLVCFEYAILHSYFTYVSVILKPKI